MLQFYTKEFFQELARRLNADPDWRRVSKGLSLTILCAAADRGRSFFIQIRSGKVTTRPAPADAKSDFKFEGTYDTWVQVCKGEAELDKLIQTGRMRFAGSMPELMAGMGPLNRIVLMARSFPKEF